jgi:hypothetical protein
MKEKIEVNAEELTKLASDYVDTKHTKGDSLLVHALKVANEDLDRENKELLEKLTEAVELAEKLESLLTRALNLTVIAGSSNDKKEIVEELKKITNVK